MNFSFSRFIDFGNMEEKEASQLMELPAELAQPPPFAQLVRLPSLEGLASSEENQDLLYDFLRWSQLRM